MIWETVRLSMRSIRRNVLRWYWRWLPAVRRESIRPWSS